MEEKIDLTTVRLNQIGNNVNDAALQAEQLIQEVEALGKLAVEEFNKLKAGLCPLVAAFPPISDALDCPVVTTSVTGQSPTNQFATPGLRTPGLRTPGLRSNM